VVSPLPVFRKAASKGNAKALEAMAALSRSGEPESARKAMSVLVSAADSGSARAKELLEQLKNEKAESAGTPFASRAKQD
jgi:hypothetical protein